MIPTSLSDLNAGDMVAVSFNYMEFLSRIERVTEKYIIVDGTKYRKSDGYAVGNNKWNIKHISVATAEIQERIKQQTLHRQLCNKIIDTQFNRLAIEKLQAIWDIIQSK